VLGTIVSFTDTSIVVTSPANSAGTGSVYVYWTGGGGTNTGAPGSFTYTVPSGPSLPIIQQYRRRLQCS
jgi:hypothetical protein